MAKKLIGILIDIVSIPAFLIIFAVTMIYIGVLFVAAVVSREGDKGNEGKGST